MAIATLNAERLRELLIYDPNNGLFTRRVAVGRHDRWAAGAKVGSLTNCGYLCARVDGRLYQCHRLAWLYTFGQWPQLQIDHIDGNALNNQISNLRDVSASVNRQNTRTARSDNRSGLAGVTADKRRGTYRAQIKVAGCSHFLGSFKDAQAAHDAYLNAKRSMHVGCTI